VQFVTNLDDLFIRGNWELKSGYQHADAERLSRSLAMLAVKLTRLVKGLNLTMFLIER